MVVELSSEQNLQVKLVRNQETDIRKNPEARENKKKDHSLTILVDIY